MYHYAIKFKDVEQRENFRKFCEFVGWGFYPLNGLEHGWGVETNNDKDNLMAINYLHNLGAFQTCDE